MSSTIIFKRSSTTAIVPGVTTLAFGSPVFTDISGVKSYYIGDENNLAQLVAGDAFAKLASPAFSGTPTAPTQSTSDNSTKLATTEFVQDVFATIVTSPDYKEGVLVASNATIADLSNIDVTDFDGTGQGITLVEGNRVMINNLASPDGIISASGAYKGIYVVGVVTTGFAALTRSSDANTSAEVTNGMTVSNTQSGTFANYRFVLTTADPITLDTTVLSFTAIPNAGYSAGNGIDIVTNTISVEADATGGANLAKAINVSVNGVAVKIDDTTIGSNGSDQLFIKDAGVGVNQLNTSVAGAGLAGGGGSALSVNVDDSSIEINADTLRVKALGVTNAMLAGSIADSKLSTITTANKVSGSAVQLATGSAIENNTGLDVNIDGTSIINTAGELSVGTIDGGTF